MQHQAGAHRHDYYHDEEHNDQSEPVDMGHRPSDRTEQPAPRFRMPHPRFGAHFRHRIYDPDDYRNDETMPFGTDDGADTAFEWNERADQLIETTTLRSLLDPEADKWVKGEYEEEDDDYVITTGFSLLRFAGRIDAEGSRWLEGALVRQVGRGAGREYRRMLKDLKTFLIEAERAAPSATPAPHGQPVARQRLGNRAP